MITIKSSIYPALLLISAGFFINVNAHDDPKIRDLDSVLGGLEVEKNGKARDVSTVNGGIELGAHSSVRDVEAVNGGIDVADNVQARSIETVNGGIEIGKNFSAEKSIISVNGGIAVGSGSKVGQDIITVNGGINLTGVSVGRHVKTNNGDIHLTQGTIVKGDIIVEKSEGWFSSWSASDDLFVIEIDASSSVAGTIHLHKKVELKIDENAKVGKIEYHYPRK